jgi:hypothetical protein
MSERKDALLAELKAVISAVSGLTEQDGVSLGQRKYVLEVLEEYVASLEHDPLIATDCNRVSRIVVEYWPMNLAVGERVIGVEQRMGAFTGQRK